MAQAQNEVKPKEVSRQKKTKQKMYEEQIPLKLPQMKGLMRSHNPQNTLQDTLVFIENKRKQVLLQHQTDVKELRREIGEMRLALRNSLVRIDGRLVDIESEETGQPQTSQNLLPQSENDKGDSEHLPKLEPNLKLRNQNRKKKPLKRHQSRLKFRRIAEGPVKGNLDDSYGHFYPMIQNSVMRAAIVANSCTSPQEEDSGRLFSAHEQTAITHDVLSPGNPNCMQDKNNEQTHAYEQKDELEPLLVKPNTTTGVFNPGEVPSVYGESDQQVGSDATNHTNDDNTNLNGSALGLMPKPPAEPRQVMAEARPSAHQLMNSEKRILNLKNYEALMERLKLYRDGLRPSLKVADHYRVLVSRNLYREQARFLLQHQLSSDHHEQTRNPHQSLYPRRRPRRVPPVMSRRNPAETRIDRFEEMRSRDLRNKNTRQKLLKCYEERRRKEHERQKYSKTSWGRLQYELQRKINEKEIAQA